MTTRNRAKKPTVDQAPSITASTDDSESRRSSLDDARPTTSHSHISQVSANNAQVPEIAETAATPDALNTLDQPGVAPDLAERISKALTPFQQTLSPSLKRKRSPTPPVSQNGLFVSESPSQQLIHQALEEGDAAEVVPLSLLSDREVSDTGSSQSREQANDALVVGVPSVDATPIVSQVHSPASSISGAEDLAEKQQPQDVVDVVMDMDDAGAAEEIDEVEEEDELDDHGPIGVPGRPVKRLGGKRRRAIHPDIQVEVTMRRQLDLRKGYRNTVRDLKAVLAEIAQRELDDLKINATKHEEASEHAVVKTRLDDALEKRCAHIRTQQTLERELLEERLVAEKKVIDAGLRLQLEDAEDMFFDRIEREMLEISRAAQLEDNVQQLDTEDEDDIIPRPKGMAYRFKRGTALDPVYDSRSLPALQVGHALDDMDRKLEMQKMLDQLTEQEKPDQPETFTVMDRAVRDATLARQQEVAAKELEVTNANVLVEAATEFERIANIPVIPNEEAHGLQLLGGLAVRPAILIPAQHAVRMKQESNAMAKQMAPQPQHAPPPPPVPQEEVINPVEFSASPRARQMIRERFEAKMAPPPPHTPRQSDVKPAQTPDHRQQELQMRSPQAAHMNSLQPLTARPSEHERPQFPERGPFRPARFDPVRDDQLKEQKPPQESLQSINTQSTHWPDRAQAVTGVPDRRARSTDGRRAVDFTRATPLPGGRHEATHASPTMEASRFNYNDQTSFPNGLLHSRPFDRPASPGAIDQRAERGDLPVVKRPRLAINTPEAPHSRRSSVSVKQEVRSDSSQVGDVPRQREPGGKPKWRKTNKEERGGMSRRANKNKNKDKKRQHSVNGPGFGGPSQAGAPFRTHSPAQQAQPPHHWQAQSMQQTMPPPAHAQHPSHIPPSQPFDPRWSGQLPQQMQFDQPRHDYDYGHPNHHYHRNSYPPPQLGPPGWSQPPPSPLYALPTAHQPPPPGVPPDQYRGQNVFMPPPPPNYQGYPPTTNHAPQHGPGPYGQQYGGQAIAPATPDRFHPPGYGPGPRGAPPVFAQQQAAHRNEESRRRRTQSDAHHRDHRQWNSYHGPPGKR